MIYEKYEYNILESNVFRIPYKMQICFLSTFHTQLYMDDHFGFEPNFLLASQPKNVCFKNMLLKCIYIRSFVNITKIS